MTRWTQDRFGQKLTPGVRAVANDTLVVVVVQLLNRGSLALLTVAAAHFLTVRQLTSFNYFLVTSSFLGSFLSAGLPVAAARLASQGPSGPDGPAARGMGAIVWALGAAALLATLLAPLYLPWLLADEAATSPLLLFAAGMGLASISTVMAALQGAGAFRASLAPAVLGGLVLGIAGAVSLWVRDEGGLMIAVVLFYLLPTLVMARSAAVRLELGATSLRTPSRAMLAEVAQTALPSLGNALIFSFVNWWVARSLIEHQTTPTAFVEFAIGMQWFAFALFIPLSFSASVFPRYLRMASTGDKRLSAVLMPAAAASLITLAVGLVAVPATPVLSIAYGGSYQFSHTFVATIFLAAAVSAPAGLIGQYIIASRGASMWLKIYLAFLTIGLLGPTLFVPRTATGAVMILCACYVSVLLIGLGLLLRGLWKPRPPADAQLPM